MRSEALDVDAYMAEVPPVREACLQMLRAACQKLLPGFEESMAYGMPSYARDGEGEVAFASQKQYIALYMPRTNVVARYRDRLAGLNVGTGCIRYRRPEQVNHDVVSAMLADTAGSKGPVC